VFTSISIIDVCAERIRYLSDYGDAFSGGETVFAHQIGAGDGSYLPGEVIPLVGGMYLLQYNRHSNQPNVEITPVFCLRFPLETVMDLFGATGTIVQPKLGRVVIFSGGCGPPCL
jgi:hypothetical protein